MPSKLINYRNGIVRFKVSSNWHEDYEPSGGAMFYEDRPDSGTFRISVLGFKSNKKSIADDFAFEALSKLGGSRKVQRLPHYRAIARYKNSVTEDAEQLITYYWEVAVPVSSAHLRIVVFSYTVFATQAFDPIVQSELQMLDSTILRAEFSTQAGEE